MNYPPDRMAGRRQLGCEPSTQNADATTATPMAPSAPLGSLRKGETAVSEHIIWDAEEPGFGRRIRHGRQPVWVLQLRLGGKTVRRALGLVSELDQNAARLAARERRRALEGRPASPQTGAPRFDQFAKQFLTDCSGRWKPNTQSAHAHIVKGVLHEAFGRKRIDTICRADIVSWFQTAKGSDNRALSVMSSIMRHAETLGLRGEDTNPCQGLRRKWSGFVAHCPQPDDYRRIGLALDQAVAAEPILTAMIRFIALTGARLGEAIGLRLANIEGSRAILHDSKHGPKTIWLALSVRNLLDGIAKSEESPYVFASTSRASLDARLGNFWRKLRHSIGLDKVRIHDLRHGFATVGVNHREDLHTISGLLGHRDFSTTLAYAHLADRPTLAAARRVSRNLALAMEPKQPVERLPKRPQLVHSFLAETEEERQWDRHVRAFHKCSRRMEWFCERRGLETNAFRAAIQRFHARQRAALKAPLP